MLRLNWFLIVAHDDRTGLSPLMHGTQGLDRTWGRDWTWTEGTIVKTVLSAVNTGTLAAVAWRLEE